MREVLQVLNRSRDDEQAVFDVILDNALRLCDAHLGLLFLQCPVAMAIIGAFTENKLLDNTIQSFST